MANIEGKVVIGCPGQGLSPEVVSRYYQGLREMNRDVVDGTIDVVQGFVNKEKVKGWDGEGLNLLEMAGNPQSPNYKKTSAYQSLVHSLNVAAFDVAIASGKLDGINLAYAGGHSMGEFGAAVIAGMLSREDGAHIMVLRGKFIQQDCDRRPSTLVREIGLDELGVGPVASQTKSYLSLVNASKIIVVGLVKEDRKNVVSAFKAAGGKGVSELMVEGAFHTPFVSNAMTNLYIEIGKLMKEDPRDNPVPLEVRDPGIPMVSGLEGKIVDNGQRMLSYMVKNIAETFRYNLVVDTLRERGVEYFIECGPGDSLAKLNKANGFPEDWTVNIVNL